MATGDILSFIVDSTGWYATVKVEGVGVGGAYDFGYGAKNDPTNAKITVNLTSQGYTGDTFGTTTRSVLGVPCITNDTGAMRKVYPNETDPNETVSGSDVDIVIALSDYIYSADTSITVDFLSDWYNSSNSVSGLSVTNNSTVSYPKPIGNWAYPGYSKVTGDFDVEVTAFHRFDVAAVKISATDGSTTAIEIITDLTISPKADYKKVLVYESTIDTSGFNDGIITVDFIVYPKVGNASSLLESDDAVNTWPTPLYTSQKYRLDTVGVHGFTVVDQISGNDGTGVVYNSQVLAEAGLAYKTNKAALTAVQAYNNANAGHNDAGGGVLLLTEDTHLLWTTNGGTMSEWCTFKPISTAIKANVIIQAEGNNSTFPSMFKMQGCTYTGSTYFTGSNSMLFWIEDNDINTTGTLTCWSSPFLASTFNTGVVAKGYTQFSTAVTSWGIIRGNNHAGDINGQGYITLGNRNVSFEERGAVTNPDQSGSVYAFNYLDHGSDTVQISVGNTSDISNVAIIQNVLIRYGSQIQPLIILSADGTTTSTENILFWHNTTVGARENLGYNDTGSGGPYPQDQWSRINNIHSNYNNKDDTFGDNPDAIGSWPVGYSVGSTGEFYRRSQDAEWIGEFQGVGVNFWDGATPLEPLYIDDQSADGGNTSGGDYHLQEISPARDIVYRDVLPYDLDGRIRKSNGSTGALEYYESVVNPKKKVIAAVNFFSLSRFLEEEY